MIRPGDSDPGRSPEPARPDPAHGSPRRGVRASMEPPPPRGPAAWRVLLPLAGVELLLLAALGWGGGARFPLPGLLLLLGAFGAYLVAALRVRELAGGHVLIWVVAVALRLLFLPLEPVLSDDVWRYLWDGHVQLSGVNPYRFAPSAPELAALRTPWHALINNPDVPTIYPPFAQLAFLAVALAGSTVLQAKLLFLGFDLATGWLLGRVARLTGRSRRLVQLLYLWSPLLVVEVAWSAHLEPLGLFGLVLLLLLARAPVGAGVAGALSALTKVAPAAALPALTRRLGWRFAAAFLATCAVLYLPYVGAGTALFAGLGVYAEHWRFMAGPFALLEAVLPGPHAPRWAAAAGVVAVVAWTTWRGFRPERALLWILGTGLLLTPTLHPWYVLWILPLAALRASAPWILLSGLAFLGYFGLDAWQASGVWPQPGWLRVLMWGPVLALLVWEGTRRRGRDAPPARTG